LEDIMSVILFKRGTGSPVKVNEHGFEHSVASGEYFLTKDAAISADKVAAEAVELPKVEEETPLEAEKAEVEEVALEQTELLEEEVEIIDADDLEEVLEAGGSPGEGLGAEEGGLAEEGLTEEVEVLDETATEERHEKTEEAKAPRKTRRKKGDLK
jgi:hypothetical protein